MGGLLHSEITYAIVGAAFAVHSELGPGYVEKVYERALLYELQTRGLAVSDQVEVPIYYQGMKVHHHRLDLLVEDKVIVEIKAVSQFTDVHIAVLLSYLKATKRDIGLLLNFALDRLEHKRLVRPPITPKKIR